MILTLTEISYLFLKQTFNLIPQRSLKTDSRFLRLRYLYCYSFVWEIIWVRKRGRLCNNDIGVLSFFNLFQQLHSWFLFCLIKFRLTLWSLWWLINSCIWWFRLQQRIQIGCTLIMCHEVRLLQAIYWFKHLLLLFPYRRWAFCQLHQLGRRFLQKFWAVIICSTCSKCKRFWFFCDNNIRLIEWQEWRKTSFIFTNLTCIYWQVIANCFF